jgi:origin recognition complex subunit 1
VLDPHASLVLWQCISGNRCAHVQAAKLLDARFSGGCRRKDQTVVLLVDELDHLVTRKQTVLYNLFDWPTRPNSNLVVIGIANTMDLDERLLKRIASRLGLTKIQFKPYTKEQLVSIIKVVLLLLPLWDFCSFVCISSESAWRFGCV